MSRGVVDDCCEGYCWVEEGRRGGREEDTMKHYVWRFAGQSRATVTSTQSCILSLHGQTLILIDTQLFSIKFSQTHIFLLKISVF